MIRGSALAFALALSLVAIVAAKGPTVRLVISGASLAEPVEITDPKALVHVWSTDFIGERTTETAHSLPRYTVSFYVKPPRSEVRMMYVVHYTVDPRTGDGFVHFPGRGEEWWQLNVSTIWREQHDGRWFKAAVTWNAAIRSRVLSQL